MSTTVYGYDIDTVDGRSAATAIEYGAYVAVLPIYVGDALAYGTGDAVPITNVHSNSYTEDEVTLVGTDPTL